MHKGATVIEVENHPGKSGAQTRKDAEAFNVEWNGRKFKYELGGINSNTYAFELLNVISDLPGYKIRAKTKDKDGKTRVSPGFNPLSFGNPIPGKPIPPNVRIGGGGMRQI